MEDEHHGMQGHSAMDPMMGHNPDMDNYDNMVDESEAAAGKIFVGGLSWQTTEDGLKYYFEKYGELIDVALMTDKRTGQPRGFGFATFKDPAAVDIVLGQTHNIDGRVVDVKRAVPRDKAPAPSRQESRKIFVGGLAPEVGDKEFRDYFSKYGALQDSIVMYDRKTNRSRGFGFVTFETEESLQNVLRTEHEIMGKWVEIKRAEPREARPGGAPMDMMRMDGRGGLAMGGMYRGGRAGGMMGGRGGMMGGYDEYGAPGYVSQQQYMSQMAAAMRGNGAAAAYGGYPAAMRAAYGPGAVYGGAVTGRSAGVAGYPYASGMQGYYSAAASAYSNYGGGSPTGGGARAPAGRDDVAEGYPASAASAEYAAATRAGAASSGSRSAAAGGGSPNMYPYATGASPYGAYGVGAMAGMYGAGQPSPAGARPEGAAGFSDPSAPYGGYRAQGGSAQGRADRSYRPY